MASIDNSGGQGIGDTLNAVREQARAQSPRPEQEAQRDATPRVERDVLSLSPEALSRQNQLENASFDRNIDEERASLLVLQVQQSIAAQQSGSLIGAGNDSQRLISFLR